MSSKSPSGRARQILFEALLGLFLFGLLLAVLLPPQSLAGGPEAVGLGEAVSGLLPAQGTPVVATINGSLDGSEPVFTGQALLATGIPSDKNCLISGKSGARFYDEVVFFNPTMTDQKVSIGFSSSCGANTYMAAYYQQFNPAKICENFIASPGNSGNSILDFTVCPNSQFTIVIYGAEPGAICVSYTYNVFAEGITLIGPASRGLKPAGAGSAERILAEEGTPLVATVVDAIDEREPRYTGRAHANTSVPGERNCKPGGTGTFFYDEYFFFNNSSTTQTVSVSSNLSFCAGVIFMAAYSPQFNPNDICQNFIGSIGRPFLGNWDFNVCPNSMFSIVAYGPFRCSGYTYQVFGNEITFLGTVADLAISKTGPSGPVQAGSNITYTITATNNGPNQVTNVRISDPLPAGTTFVSLIRNPGAGVLCSTPPVGSNGTVVCNTGRLTPPGFFFNFASISIVVNVGPSAPALLSNTATVSRLGIDPDTSNNSSTAPVSVLNLCLQDARNGNILRFNSSTGDYQFFNCRKNTSLSGRGRLTINGCKITLQDTGPDPKRPDRNVQVDVNTCTRVGLASVQSSGVTSTISDSDITNNTCACQ